MLTNPHVLVVEDEHASRFLCEFALQNEGLDVASVGSGAEALERLRETRYRLMLLDLNLPDMDGLKVARQAWRRFHLPTLIMTVRDAPDERVAGLNCGAVDYLVKPFHPAELIHRVRRVLRDNGDDYSEWDAEVVWGEWRLQRDSGLLEAGQGPVVPLTNGETELLSVMMRARGRPVSREHLAGVVSRGSGGNLRSVDVLVSRVRRKLDEAGVEDARLVTVAGIGYRLTSDVAA